MFEYLPGTQTPAAVAALLSFNVPLDGLQRQGQSPS